jgi:hypothetical protein
MDVANASDTTYLLSVDSLWMIDIIYKRQWVENVLQGPAALPIAWSLTLASQPILL